VELSIIFVNWNTLDYLHSCIASIYEFTRDINLELIVVDNASPKGDVTTLKVPFPEIKIIQSNENLGFARANNLGFRHSAGSYVMFLNPDTKLVGPAIKIMLDRMSTVPNPGIVGCRQVDPDLTVQTTSIQRFPTILNQILGIEYLRRRWPRCRLWDLGPLFSPNPGPVNVEVIPGACMLMRRDVFARVGMFSEEYFMYAEDIDLNFKVASIGLLNYYIPEAVIIHYGGRSSSQQSVSQWATMMKFRAMGQYYAKNRGLVYAAMYRIAMGACAVCRLVILSLALPFGNILSNKEALHSAFQKWGAILRWSFGLDDPSVNTSNR
jgi:N-acetylglucosaminyl-diphospho-decaprenol L-rhamnosyltransferase